MAADKKSKKLDKTDKATDKQTALENALKQIEKQYGAGAIMRLGENKHLNVDAISTGSLSLDIATGINGLPKGRIVEIYGPESSGKTTLALHCVAEAQKAGGQAAFIDAEHALDPIYAANLGVDVDSLLVAQPDYGEQALEIAEQLARSGAIDIIVVDSVAALVPRTEIDDDMGDSHVGLHARLMSQAMRKLAGAINKSNTLIIFINQLREKVGVVYGNPEVTTGGRALKFYASMRIDVRKGEQLKNSDNQFIGSRTKVKIVKNKVAPPFRSAEFDIMYGTGISKEGEILDLGVEYGVIKKGGSWFSYGDRRLGQGRDNVKQLIKDEPEFAAQLEQEIKEKIAEVQAASDKKYQPKVAPKADTDAAPTEESTARQTRAAARAKLDIAVEDDDE
jgi:recombination protein RecA